VLFARPAAIASAAPGAELASDLGQHQAQRGVHGASPQLRVGKFHLARQDQRELFERRRICVVVEASTRVEGDRLAVLDDADAGQLGAVEVA
jgi:DNA replication initiation complex subunit (GINS family)